MARAKSEIEPGFFQTIARRISFDKEWDECTKLVLKGLRRRGGNPFGQSSGKVFSDGKRVP